MNNIAHINGIEVNRIKSKVALGIKLTDKERSFYLLYVATSQEVNEYLKNEKEIRSKK